MKFKNFFFHSPTLEDFEYIVNINISILKRIRNSISNSNVEEGGKLIGNILRSKNKIIINAFSFIDSGPNVSNSLTHIIPDGEHQENLFRLIEGYDHTIEHIGSWHSHHCNNYKNLSKGDIEGYYASVNNQNFNLNWFFAILVLGIDNNQLQNRFFLFQRGYNNYVEISPDNINLLNDVFVYENVLSEMEKLSYSYRRLEIIKNPVARFNNSQYKSDTKESRLSHIRLEDKIWFKNEFPNAIFIHSKIDNRLKWKWSIPIFEDVLKMEYIYPENDLFLGNAILSISHKNKELKKVDLELSEGRFTKIKSAIEFVLTKIDKVNEK